MEKKDIRTPVPTIYGNFREKFGSLWEKQIEFLNHELGEIIKEVRTPETHPTDVPIVYVDIAKIVDVLNLFKTDPQLGYDFLSDMTAVDEYPSTPRFEVVYNLFSTQKHCRFRVKVRVEENVDMDTITGLWKAANWLEREIFDMFGIKFKNHPDLRRILLDDRWQGHPLRKDYPLKGYQIFPTPMAPKEELLKGD